MNHSLDGLKLMREFVKVRNERDDVYQNLGVCKQLRFHLFKRVYHSSMV